VFVLLAEKDAVPQPHVPGHFPPAIVHAKSTHRERRERLRHRLEEPVRATRRAARDDPGPQIHAKETILHLLRLLFLKTTTSSHNSRAPLRLRSRAPAAANDRPWRATRLLTSESTPRGGILALQPVNRSRRWVARL
jgi:hypothetical protein